MTSFELGVMPPTGWGTGKSSSVLTVPTKQFLENGGGVIPKAFFDGKIPGMESGSFHGTVTPAGGVVSDVPNLGSRVVAYTLN